MNPITDRPTLDGVLERGSALLLKHGARCPISAHARDEVTTFAAAHPELAIYSLEVTDNPELSSRVSEALGIRHESPQAIVLRDGRAVWHATHYDIDSPALERHAAAGGAS